DEAQHRPAALPPGPEPDGMSQHRGEDGEGDDLRKSEMPRPGQYAGADEQRRGGHRRAQLLAESGREEEDVTVAHQETGHHTFDAGRSGASQRETSLSFRSESYSPRHRRNRASAKSFPSIGAPGCASPTTTFVLGRLRSRLRSMRPRAGSESH